jgi:hypothetical protein
MSWSTVVVVVPTAHYIGLSNFKDITRSFTGIDAFAVNLLDREIKDIPGGFCRLTPAYSSLLPMDNSAMTGWSRLE